MLANKTLLKTSIRYLLYFYYIFATISENANFIFFVDICYNSKTRLYKSLSQITIRYYN